MSITTQRRNELRDQVAAVLDSLGDDRTEVAQRLWQAGVQGTPRHPGDCAIAVYLSATVACDPEIRSLKVLGDRVILFPARIWRAPIIVREPSPLTSFIMAFDDGKYPQLIRGHEDRVPEAEGGVGAASRS